MTFCFPFIFNLFIRHFHPEAIESWQRHVMVSIFCLMGNTSDYAFRNWENIVSYAVIPIAEYYKDQRIFKAKAIFYFVKFMFMALCTKCT